MTTKRYIYDVAISFAGEDRIHAEALAEALDELIVKAEAAIADGASLLIVSDRGITPAYLHVCR